jgi:hypothetical protein
MSRLALVHSIQGKDAHHSSAFKLWGILDSLQSTSFGASAVLLTVSPRAKEYSRRKTLEHDLRICESSCNVSRQISTGVMRET